MHLYRASRQRESASNESSSLSIPRIDRPQYVIAQIVTRMITIGRVIGKLFGHSSMRSRVKIRKPFGLSMCSNGRKVHIRWPASELSPYDSSFCIQKSARRLIDNISRGFSTRRRAPPPLRPSVLRFPLIYSMFECSTACRHCIARRCARNARGPTIYTEHNLPYHQFSVLPTSIHRFGGRARALATAAASPFSVFALVCVGSAM